ncbi:hypothetical protein [Neobacillus massiliamazoniensis]|uniref:YhcE protein n=1 Tax=Neobacillus massiliamazoniensis TaxID=1499688 RepID=A0A0U1P2X9_9BACI|nr:hypothetical protein [Neobacillus massiliamazoniensis]CRK84561.1 YhcE protein [Neobacillus massiliamazoniensis]
MLAFQGLLKKDFGISKFWFLLWLIFLAVFLLIPFALEIYYHMPLKILPVAVLMLIGFHAFFLPAMLLSMLRLEGKTQLWLYNPQNSKALFLSKMAVCSIYQLIAQVFLTGVGLIIYQFYKNHIYIEAADLFMGITVFNVGLLLFGLYVSCWAIFYWTVYHSLGKFPAVKNWRWLVLLLLFFVFNTITALLAKIEFLKEIVNKWKIPILMNVNGDYKREGWEIYLNSTDIPVVGLVIYVIVAFSLFLISCWLLDRKVEV